MAMLGGADGGAEHISTSARDAGSRFALGGLAAWRRPPSGEDSVRPFQQSATAVCISQIPLQSDERELPVGERCKARVRVFVAVAVVALCVVPAASAKFKVSLSLSHPAPRLGVTVTAVIRADSRQGADCSMRLYAVAPGIDIYEALDAFTSVAVDLHRTRPPSRLGFIIATRRTGAAVWKATIRFPRAGHWKLVVPNWCAGGYALPPPVVRAVAVR